VPQLSASSPAPMPSSAPSTTVFSCQRSSTFSTQRTRRGAPRKTSRASSRQTQTLADSGRGGLVPCFFVREQPDLSGPWARRLGWHCTDTFTPIYSDLPEQLADDLAVAERSVELVLAGTHTAVYALTAFPGHHASADFYGGYCFVNHAALAVAMLRAAGRRPFLIDVDYHAGDGSADILGSGHAAARGMCSIHALHDYPYIDPSAPWAVLLPPGAEWERDYRALLSAALARRPAECDTLVLSLGFDTLKGDPCAAPGHAAALTPEDFGALRRELVQTGLPMIAFQEGGYALDRVPSAAAAFWFAEPPG